MRDRCLHAPAPPAAVEMRDKKKITTNYTNLCQLSIFNKPIYQLKVDKPQYAAQASITSQGMVETNRLTNM